MRSARVRFTTIDGHVWERTVDVPDENADVLESLQRQVAAAGGVADGLTFYPYHSIRSWELMDVEGVDWDDVVHDEEEQT